MCEESKEKGRNVGMSLCVNCEDGVQEHERLVFGWRRNDEVEFKCVEYSMIGFDSEMYEERFFYEDAA